MNHLPSLPLSERFLQWFESDLHERLNVKKIMLAEMLTVHPAYQGSGISEAFLNKVFGSAIEAKCQSFMCLVFSFCMQTKLDKFGFPVLKETKYSDWIDPETGKKTDLLLSPIHTRAKMYDIRVPPPA